MVKKAQQKTSLSEKKHTASNKDHILILFNDDVNSFEHVIDCLINICQHDSTQAEQCAFITHYKGKCEIKTGTISNLLTMKDMLLENGLNVNIQ